MLFVYQSPDLEICCQNHFPDSAVLIAEEMVLVSNIAGRWSIITTATENFSIKKLRNCSCLLKWRLIIFWARKEMKTTWRSGEKRMKLN